MGIQLAICVDPMADISLSKINLEIPNFILNLANPAKHKMQKLQKILLTEFLKNPYINKTKSLLTNINHRDYTNWQK